MELISGRCHKTAIDKTTITDIQQETYRVGAMARISGANIILSPPLVLTADDVTGILTALDASFAATT
ncbi:MAG: hypothetical protein HRU33_26955 [Rhodobacteraceae bacterium]|nr:hypothetical protein [Paracoccaceae bacterium]